MLRIFGVTLLLALAFSGIQQDKQPVNVCRLETKYNGLEDKTTIQCDNLIKWGEAPVGLTLKANVSFLGKDPIEERTFWLSLHSNRGVKTRQPQPLFQSAKSLYLFLDSERMEIPVREYHTSFYELIRSFEETAIAEIGRRDLQKVLVAKSLKGEWGTVEFKFSAVSLASLKDFILRQTSISPSR